MLTFFSFYFNSFIYSKPFCFRIGKLLKYNYLIFANNDILVPQGAVDMCRRSLLTEPLVVPLTTKKGAGHNPSQVLLIILFLHFILFYFLFLLIILLILLEYFFEIFIKYISKYICK